LERALHTLVAPGQRLDTCDDDSARRTQTGDALTYVQLLMENAVATGTQATNTEPSNIHVACESRSTRGYQIWVPSCRLLLG
jgi:hypothetical protein